MKKKKKKICTEHYYLGGGYLTHFEWSALCPPVF